MAGLEPAAVVARRVEGLAVVECGWTGVEYGVGDGLAVGFADARDLERDHVLAPDNAHGDQFNLAVFEMIAVVETVLLVKAGSHLAQIRRGDLAVRQAGP